MDCGLDVKLVEQDAEGDYLLEFTLPGATKKSTRWFKSIDSALRMASFVAAQNGVNRPETLYPWLEARGFPGRCPNAGPDIEILEDTSTGESSSEVGSGGGVVPDAKPAPSVDDV